jgi:dethiobiotin synthetase
MIKGWFITGTDTDVGKTRVSEALLRAIASTGRRAVGMKPVATGAQRTSAGLRSADAELLRAASSVRVAYEAVNPYAFELPIAPLLAATEEGVEIDVSVIQAQFRALSESADWVVVEGIGGWRVPVAPGVDLNHLARSFGLPVVLVVRARVGCINHALLTAESVRAEGCELAGWVLNMSDAVTDAGAEMAQLLRERIKAPLLGTIESDPTEERWLAHGAEILSRLLS